MLHQFIKFKFLNMSFTYVMSFVPEDTIREGDHCISK